MLDISNLQGPLRTGFVTEDGSYITPVGRLSFSHFFQKSAPPKYPDQLTFNCEFIFNTGNPHEPGFVDLGQFKAHVEGIVSKFFQEKSMVVPFEYPRRIWNGLKHADYEGYGAGTEYIAPKSYDEIPNVLVIGQDPSVPLTQAQFKNGDFFRLKVQPYISKDNWTTGVSYGLRSAQLVLPWTGFSSVTPDTGAGFDAIPTSGNGPTPMGW